MQSPAVKNTLQISWPIVFAGFFIGLMLSFGVLSGDDNGRVNLLYLLMVYLFIPLLGALLSLVSLVWGRGLNLARLVSASPLWPQSQKHFLHKMRQMHLDKYWFFLQSQAAGLAYSAASVLIFMLLLLATDINFIWRSTVLDAEQLLPLLKIVAAPWPFWEAAQPTIERLRLTQDSRLMQTYSGVSSFGQWWAFILATQIFYSFLLRGLLLIGGKVWLNGLMQREMGRQLSTPVPGQAGPHKNNFPLAPILSQLPTNFALTNWAGFAPPLLASLNLTPTTQLQAGPHVDALLQQEAEAFQGEQLLLVKAWEPPLGELQDYMEHGQGLLFPINLSQQTPIKPETRHLEEWQRFVKTQDRWRIYLPAPWIHPDES